MKNAMLLMLIIILSACSKPVGKTAAPLLSSEISGAVIWTRIVDETDYKTYSFWPGHEDMQPGQSPHGVFHRIYINKILFDSLPVSNRIAPEGTIIVKENFTSEKKIDALTVMVKVKGYNPDSGDWFWVKYTPEGEVLAEGAPKGCLGCHIGMAGNDFIIVRPLDLKTDTGS